MSEGTVVINQPGVYLVDEDGNTATLADGDTIASTEGVIIAGKDGTVARFVKVSSASRLVTDGSEVTQPVSAVSLPLPSGAATETTLSALNTNAADIETILTAIRDTAGIKKITDQLPAGTNNIGDVDIVSSALPTGAATEATLATLATQVTAAAIQTILTAIRDTAGVKKITDAVTIGSQPASVSSGNSTATPLGVSGTFTGAWEDTLSASFITVNAIASHASAQMGVIIEWSSDGVNVDGDDIFTLPAASGKVWTFGPSTRYFRVRYINGTTAQTYFRLQTVFRQMAAKSSSHRLDDSVVDEDDAELVKSAITGRSATGVYTVVPLSSSGKLLVEASAPTPPPATSLITIENSSPLAIVTTTDVNYIITNGKTFHLQQIVAGCEGDTSERGSVAEIFYFDGTTERLIERLYLNGFTVYGTFNDLNKARDATSLTGNGTTKTIRVRRRRLSGSAQEVDLVVRGYEL